MIAANHLNLLDSLLIHHVLGSVSFYLLHFRKLAWNLPAAENFKAGLFLSVYTYLGKCIPVYRQADAATGRRLIERLATLLRMRETIVIFPEGGRSRTGRLDAENLTYGVGQLMRAVPECPVLCLYLRSPQQERHGFLPARGSEIHCSWKFISPGDRQSLSAAESGSALRESRRYARQVMENLQELEEAFFERIPA